MNKHASNFVILWTTVFVLVIVGLVYTSSLKVLGKRVIMGQKYTAVLHAQTTQSQK